jgi:hypothetical protein
VGSNPTLSASPVRATILRLHVLVGQHRIRARLNSVLSATTGVLSNKSVVLDLHDRVQALTTLIGDLAAARLAPSRTPLFDSHHPHVAAWTQRSVPYTLIQFHRAILNRQCGAGVAVRWRGQKNQDKEAREGRLKHSVSGSLSRRMQPLGLPKVSRTWAPYPESIQVASMCRPRKRKLKRKIECESSFAWCLYFCSAQRSS